MARRKHQPLPPIEYTPAPPCAECGRESDDTATDGRRLCGECNPEYGAEHRAMLKAMRLGAWQPYARPIF